MASVLNRWIKKSYYGGAVATTLAGAINNSVTSFNVTLGSNFGMDGTDGPFVCVIDRGLATEEKVLVFTRVGNALTVVERGYDDTTAQAHSNLATIEHCIDANSMAHANALASAFAENGSIGQRISTLAYGELPIDPIGYILESVGANLDFQYPKMHSPSAIADGAAVPAGDATGQVRWSTTLNALVWWNGSAWLPVQQKIEVARAVRTTSQSGIAVGPTDLTGYSVTFTAVSGRKYLFLAHVPYQFNTAGITGTIALTDSSNTNIAMHQIKGVSVGEDATATIIKVLDTLSGSVTYKLRGSCNSGSITPQAGNPGTAGPGMLQVLDLGPL